MNRRMNIPSYRTAWRVTIIAIAVITITTTVPSFRRNNVIVSAFTTSSITKPNSVPRYTVMSNTRRASKATTNDDTATDPITVARDDVLLTAQSIAADSPAGSFITSSTESERLNRFVTELEALSSSSFTERERLLAIGDWELVCTSTNFRSPSNPRRRSLLSKPSFPLPPFLPSLPTVQDALRRSLTVTQRVRATGDDGTTIDRVDNVVEFVPPVSVKDLIPDAGFDLQLPNPLGVSRSKVTLVHDAEVESLGTVFRMKIALKSVVATVAGTSQYLEPDGSDIFGVNVPSVNDFSNSGIFDTTYVDDRLRISRGKAVPGSTGGNTSGIGGETLRVFVRKDDDSAVAVEGVVTSNVDAVNSNVGVGVETKDEDDMSVSDGTTTPPP